MKDLTQYLTERLKIKKISNYKYYPTSKKS